MAASVLPPPPPLHPDIPQLSRPPTAAGPRATLPPALLSRAAAAIQVVPLRCNAQAGSHGSKKRSPSWKDSKRSRTQPSPPASLWSVVAAVTAERKRALDKKVAGCLLIRCWGGGAAARQEERTALRCLCRELPRGSRCALHQDAPGRSWMEQQQGGVVRPVGEETEVALPKVRAGAAPEVFAEYARWRRSVRMPSRFYMEHVRAINAGQTD